MKLQIPAGTLYISTVSPKNKNTSIRNSEITNSCRNFVYFQSNAKKKLDFYKDSEQVSLWHLPGCSDFATMIAPAALLKAVNHSKPHGACK